MPDACLTRALAAGFGARMLVSVLISTSAWAQRHPLLALILLIAADGVDNIVVQILAFHPTSVAELFEYNFNIVDSYERFDKVTDAVVAIVAILTFLPQKQVLLALEGWRILGMVLYFARGATEPWLYLVFPNLWDAAALYVLVAPLLRPAWRVPLGVFLLAGKLLQEWVLHTYMASIVADIPMYTTCGVLRKEDSHSRRLFRRFGLA